MVLPGLTKVFDTMFLLGDSRESRSLTLFSRDSLESIRFTVFEGESSTTISTFLVGLLFNRFNGLLSLFFSLGRGLLSQLKSRNSCRRARDFCNNFAIPGSMSSLILFYYSLYLILKHRVTMTNFNNKSKKLIIPTNFTTFLIFSNHMREFYHHSNVKAWYDPNNEHWGQHYTDCDFLTVIFMPLIQTGSIPENWSKLTDPSPPLIWTAVTVVRVKR